jgi:hypothetical protein
MNINELTWQQFRNDIKNKKYMHEGKSVTGWELPIHKQQKMHKELSIKLKQEIDYINSGAKKYV